MFYIGDMIKANRHHELSHYIGNYKRMKCNYYTKSIYIFTISVE